MKRKNKKNFPPSPRKLPIIGNFHQLGSSPYHSLQILSQKHGPLMLLHFRSIPMLVASSPSSAHEILKTHDLSFSSRPSLTIPNILFYGAKDIAFSPYGEFWRQLKSTVVVYMLSNTQVKSFRQVREKEISRMIDVLEESDGSLVDIGSLLMSLTNNLICRVAVGRTYDDSKLTDLMIKYLNMLTCFSVGSFIPWLSWVDRLSGLEKNARKIAKECDEFLEDVVEEHLKKKTCVGDANEVQDFVDILLDTQRDNAIDTLKGAILDMFVAGNDTTYATLKWAIAELIKHPRIMKKLQQEVTETAKGRSTILEEILRLHPAVPILVPRISTQDVKLNGYDIPKGTQVIINVWAIGRDHEIWEDPEEFRPERFLNNSIDFEWLPFGSGRRKCPGVQFAVELDMSERYGVSVHMKSPLMVMASPRVIGSM